MIYLVFIWKYKKPLGVLLLAALVIGTVAHFSHKARKAQNAAKEARESANQQQQRADGLGIVINSNSIAYEVENEKKIANQQQINSNASNTAFSASVNRDSGAFAGNKSVVNSRYCKQFPNDSTCR